MRSAGLVLADKPVGPSSFAYLSHVRALHGGVKAGHTGTLDPFASGLLLCLLGSVTRLARYLVGLDKRYLVELRLGLRTTTGDCEGEPLEQTDPATPEQIGALRGEHELPVPLASAVKIDGERAYRRFRRGEAVQAPLRPLCVHQLELRRYEPPLAEIELLVSSGTYIRSLADALGASCQTLRRLAVGPFQVDQADEGHLLSSVMAVPSFPRLEIDAAEALALRQGRVLGRGHEGRVALVHQGDLVAVGVGKGGSIRPETVLT